MPMSHRYANPAAGLLLAAGLLIAAPTAADRDHDEVRQLRRLRNAGQILSLEMILANHRRQHSSGQLLEAKLEFEQGRYVYELKLLSEDGVVREFEYDARTGELWRIEQK